MTNDIQLESSASKKYYLRSAIFLTMSVGAAALNYLYYPIIARFLNVADFGAAQALLAILFQIGAVFSGLNLVSIYLVHKLGDEDAKNAIGIMQKITVSIFFVATALVVLLHNPVMHFLRISNSTYLFLVGLALLTSIPYIVSFGYLQARKRFVAAGTLQLVTSSMKLIFGAFATVKFGVSGALLGFSVGQVAALGIFWLVCFIAKVPAWDHGLLRSLRPPSKSDLRLIHSLAGNISAIFILNVLLGVFISFDLLAARHYFVPELSGLYAGASTLSNATIFACLPLISVLLPHLEREGLKQSLRSLIRTAGMVFVIIFAALGVFLLMPKFLLGFFGSEYRSMSYMLPRLGIMMSILTLFTLTLQVGAFYRPKTTSLLACLGLAFLLWGAYTHHGNPKSLVTSVTISFAVILVVGLIELVRIYHYGHQA